MRQENKKMNHKIKAALTIFIILHIIFAVFLGMNKINFHYDEWLTFGLANNTMGGVNIENGKLYHGFSLYNDYLSVKDAERFDYEGVWENQAKDVHPPFYYVIIHTICSVFSEQSSKWFGIIPNIFFMVCIDIFLFLLAKCILKEDWLSFITAFAAGTNMLAMNMVIFLRMYEMVTFFIVCISLLFSMYFNRDKDWKFYIGCYLCAVGGTMTHYYFLVYLFFLCIFFGIRLLIQRKWKEICSFFLTFLIAGGSCVLIFPAMIKQIFCGSTRGKQAFSAIQTFQNYGKYLVEYYEILNTDIFGGVSIWILFGFCCFVFWLIYKKRLNKWVERMDLVPVMLLSAGVLYVILIAKIAPYRTDRYVMPVGWIFIVFFVWLIKDLTTVMDITGKGRLNGGILLILLFMALSSMRISDWKYKYDYQNDQQRFDIVEEYKACSVIYVYRVRSRTACNAQELKRCKDYVFVKPKGLQKLVEKEDKNQMLLYIDEKYDDAEIINTILAENTHLKGATFLFKSRYAKVYYME
ncbi:MAG: glucosyltransferase domain-containing protein [Lachnospiraceae bacterium]|nr:glucosyltransferase domain-containing protein [Lachnospiraceae bacterium]